MVKKLLANAGDIRDVGLIPGSGRFPGGGHSNRLQYSCLHVPWAEEPGGLLFIGLHRVGSNESDLAQHKELLRSEVKVSHCFITLESLLRRSAHRTVLAGGFPGVPGSNLPSEPQRELEPQQSLERSLAAWGGEGVPVTRCL